MAYQTFDPPTVETADIAARIARLRAQFGGLKIDGLVIPHEDAYQSEYLPPSEERLAYATGFTGSAGRAIVLEDRALFITDGRYTLQSERQVPGDIFHRVSQPDEAAAWMKANLKGLTLGVDPRLHSRADLDRLKGRAENLSLAYLDANPVDLVWNDRPAPPRGRVVAHPLAVAGRSAADKLADVRAAMTTDALLVASSDAVSWIFNWRGADVVHTPLVLSRVFIPREGLATIFVDPGKVGDDLVAALDGLAVLSPADTFLAALAELSQGKRVAADPDRTPEAALAAIEKRGTLVTVTDPTLKLKAVKNAAEIAGMRAAHHRDGLAMVRFLAWLDRNAVGLTEIDIVERLEAYRRDVGAVDVSFDTICGSGPHGAIVHYRVDRSTDRTVGADEPILIDSGAQYPDGTTDITRTIVAGTPSADFRVQFTRVLKGHIAIAMQRFPEGTMGSELDPLARAALWRAGYDFQHGTGHGVGAYLAVHEGPQAISKRSREPLLPGMIVSNEPGVYRTGAYGIRIEALCLVREARVPPGGEQAMLSFETLTLAPIDTRLVEPLLLSAVEIGWLDAYHARVHGALAGDLDADERAWLEERTRPIASL
ncbi:aminopeptidase P family protein [Acuticoccus mangrovi]|uniref:Aminopeptidase P family protein n=1 Tax=Acuticoccus mangrovi TaxID=2796142 RepID=A0A934IFE3_9HYPH|nr:aminopeptidase P family protein [Acuticoccus mangrovi]MBJ3775503.1 aminopeptidase P family protein [Acuticoccus mangrovi]